MPSLFRLKRNGIFQRPPPGISGCRRILLNKTNHLQPDRWRCFYLALDSFFFFRRSRTLNSFASSAACKLVFAHLVPKRGLSLCLQPFQRYVDQIEFEIVHRKLPVVVEEPRVLLGGDIRDQTFRV